MNFRTQLALYAVLAAVSLTGCDTPATRARTHATAFAKLSTSDKRLVLSGRVRKGLSAEAVKIAWGEPGAVRHDRGALASGKHADGKNAIHDGKDFAVDHWLYGRQLTLKGPMDSFDRCLPGNGVFGPHIGFTTNAGFGFGGVGNEGGLLYQPHLLLTDSEVKDAEIVDGVLQSFDIRQAGAIPLRGN